MEEYHREGIEELIADFVLNLRYENLDTESIHELKRRFVDSMGCAKGAYVEMKNRLLPILTHFSGNFRTLTGQKVSPDFAAFYNTYLIRYLDLNDTYFAQQTQEFTHPSDILGALFAIGNEIGISGKKLIEGAAVGYDLGARLCQAGALRSIGFDYTTFLQIATSAAVSKILELDKQQIENAISIALVPNVALLETRRGKLSMWKSGASADASRKGTFAALLAKEGFTGPEKPISGKYGLINQILKKFDSDLFKDVSGAEVKNTFLKQFPAFYQAQSAIESAIKLKPIHNVDDVNKITIEAYEWLINEGADSREKWNPKNRETADHSIPFVVSVAMMEKRFWLDSYNLLQDQKIYSLMQKVEVVKNKDFELFPKKLPVKITVQLIDGKDTAYTDLPKGAPENPMTDSELFVKAKKLGLQEDTINYLMRIEEDKNINFTL